MAPSPHSAFIRKTYTFTPLEEDLLSKIAAHRHPTDARVESQTLRELIREEWARIQKERRTS